MGCKQTNVPKSFDDDDLLDDELSDESTENTSSKKVIKNSNNDNLDYDLQAALEKRFDELFRAPKKKNASTYSD